MHVSKNQIEKHEGNSLKELTEQNWLFINAFLSCGNIRQAYEIAGYKGESRSAPYTLFKHLKHTIENLGDLDVTSRARLQADLKKVLDLPLADSKKELTLSEWLRIRKFVASITPEAAQQKPQISVLVINRPNVNGDKGDKDSNGINSPLDIPTNDVINIEPEPNNTD